MRNVQLPNASKQTPVDGGIARDRRAAAPGEGAADRRRHRRLRQASPTIRAPFVQDALAGGFSKHGPGARPMLLQAHGGSVGAASAGEGLGNGFTDVLPLAGKTPPRGRTVDLDDNRASVSRIPREPP